MDEAYRRHLPHLIPHGYPLFITSVLKGAIPRAMAERILAQRRRLEQEPERPNESDEERRIRHHKMILAFTDRFLDEGHGPTHLKDPQAANIVVDAILFGAGTRYELYAYVVMANHVHMLLTPIWSYRKLMQGIKGYTAYQINRLQNAEGRVFWQDESYDHFTRDTDEFYRVIEYIERNPVAAGLCARPEDWPYSSAKIRDRWPRGEPYR